MGSSLSALLLPLSPESSGRAGAASLQRVKSTCSSRSVLLSPEVGAAGVEAAWATAMQDALQEETRALTRTASGLSAISIGDIAELDAFAEDCRAQAHDRGQNQEHVTGVL